MPQNNRRSGFPETTQPGADMESSAGLSPESLHHPLKRTSYESLYHENISDAYTKQGESVSPKRRRHESASHLPIYPQRPGQGYCAFYMQTRTCKFGDRCRFDHPKWVPEGGIPDWTAFPSQLLPKRQGVADCPFFCKTQTCRYGVRCRFNHPSDNSASEMSDTPGLPELQPECESYVKTGTCKIGVACKFHHSAPTRPTLTGLFRRREGAARCIYYLKKGFCKYGLRCKFDHPSPGEIMAPSGRRDHHDQYY